MGCLLQVKGSESLLRFRVDGDQTIRLSDYVGDAVTEQCSAIDANQCTERKPTDLIQLEKEVSKAEIEDVMYVSTMPCISWKFPYDLYPGYVDLEESRYEQRESYCKE